jgi:very-short-patch-repair endonuclease
MQRITHNTDKQREVEKWVNQLGFRTNLEDPIREYCVDIYIPELNWAVEIDGPSHYKKKDRKRDKKLKEYGIEHIFHAKVAIKEDDFKRDFMDDVVKFKGANPFEDGN